MNLLRRRILLSIEDRIGWSWRNPSRWHADRHLVHLLESMLLLHLELRLQLLLLLINHTILMMLSSQSLSNSQCRFDRGSRGRSRRLCVGMSHDGSWLDLLLRRNQLSLVVAPRVCTSRDVRFGVRNNCSGLLWWLYSCYGGSGRNRWWRSRSCWLG